jgi:hypothetical protein
MTVPAFNLQKSPAGVHNPAERESPQSRAFPERLGNSFTLRWVEIASLV